LQSQKDEIEKLKAIADEKKSSPASDAYDIDPESRAADREQLITLQGLFRDAESQLQVLQAQLNGSLLEYSTYHVIDLNFGRALYRRAKEIVRGSY
jgi:hypothetical protein